MPSPCRAGLRRSWGTRRARLGGVIAGGDGEAALEGLRTVWPFPYRRTNLTTAQAAAAASAIATRPERANA